MGFTKICSYPHCRALVKVGQGNYCDKHRTKRVRPDWHKLYHTQWWLKESRKFLVINDICQSCNKAPSTEVHHSKEHNGDVAIFRDKRYWQALCHKCHTEISLKQRWGKEH